MSMSRFIHLELHILWKYLRTGNETSEPISSIVPYFYEAIIPIKSYSVDFYSADAESMMSGLPLIKSQQRSHA